MANIYVQLQKLANANTAKTFKFNKEEAATSRAWQKSMSNTAHQREVKDLIKAGLNPVLSSGGSGAQSYTTSAASGSADSAVNAYASYAGAQTSAAAQRYAAHQSYLGSAALASAQRYAASMNYAAQQYVADSQHDIAFNGPQKNVVSMIDKYLGNRADATLLDKFKSIVAPKLENIKDKPAAYLDQTGKLNTLGYRTVRAELKKLGMSTSKYYCDLYHNAFIMDNPNSIKSFWNHYEAVHKKYSQVKSRPWKSSI